MKSLLLLFPLLIVSCKRPEPTALPTRPQLSAEERVQIDAALATQVLGQELAGRISYLTEDGFQTQPLDKAPQYYLIYFSASW